jgi:dipeptidyl aminopeptidase/acylaminoacyl peptidase
VKYKRADGVQLTAQLYLPAGYDPVGARRAAF